MSSFGGGAYALANAIAFNEGYGIEDAIPTTSNNPGDLELGDIGYGTTGAITNFPSFSAGYTALLNQAQKMISGGSSVYSPTESIAQAAATYTGNGPNATQNWLSQLPGYSAASTLGSLASAAGSALTGNMAGAAQGVAKSFGFSGASFSGKVWNVENIMVLLIGIILVIIGLMSFDKTQTAITVIGNGAGKLAKHASTIAEAAA